jgi:hypothetical protein
VYAPRYRAEWLAKITEPGVRRRAELYYQQFDALAALRQEAALTGQMDFGEVGLPPTRSSPTGSKDRSLQDHSQTLPYAGR